MRQRLPPGPLPPRRQGALLRGRVGAARCNGRRLLRAGTRTSFVSVTSECALNDSLIETYQAQQSRLQTGVLIAESIRPPPEPIYTALGFSQIQTAKTPSIKFHQQ